MIDNLFLLAVASLGWGLSLATYRLFARSKGWPMGALQANLPILPVSIGLIGLIAGLLFATARGADNGGWIIIAFGVLLAAVWTGLLRVGSQISLFLVPIVTVPLLLGWLAAPLGYSERKWATEQPVETLRRRGLLKPEAQPAPPATDSTETPPPAPATP